MRLQRVLKLACLVLLLAVTIWRHADLKQKFPQAEKEGHQVGESISYEGLSYQLDSIEVYTEQEMYEQYQVKESEFDLQYFLASVKVKNDGEEEKRIRYALQAQIGNSLNGIDIESVYTLNPSLQSSLKSGQETQILIPFAFDRRNFTEKQWEGLKTEQMELVFDFYPKRISFLRN